MQYVNTTKLKTILIIGVGNIGFRHFQSINKTKKKIKVYIFDKSYSFFNKQLNNKDFQINKKIHLEKLSNLNLRESIDVCILSTNSKERFGLTKKIIKQKIKNIIFEKVVFQKIIHFKKIMLLLKKHKVKAYVNCPRRVQKIFQNIKIKSKKNLRHLHVKYEGSNWGICSNSIHFLDLMFFFSKSLIDFKIEDRLHQRIYLSKRKNYFELKGKLVFNNKNFKLTLIDNSNIKYSNLEININAGEKIYTLTSLKKKYLLTTKENKNIKKQTHVKIPLQSTLTLLEVNKLIVTNSCGLTPFKESFFMHKVILKFFKKKFETILRRKINYCPIT
jgi:hypothetical protein